MAKKWIAKAMGRGSRGALHRALGVPEGQKIPASKMAEAAHSKDPHIRRMVALARTFARMRHGG